MANIDKDEVMLKMTDIHKSYDELDVLKGINLEVCRGEVLAIIGPSGSGKSTLLRCINKLETIDKGSIAIKGRFLVQTKDVTDLIIKVLNAVAIALLTESAEIVQILSDL